MSQETPEWLNNMILVGYTEKYGNAWHYNATLQGEEPNHYPGAIPEQDVIRRLFNWSPLKLPFYYYFEKDGNKTRMEAPDRCAIVASDNGDLLGVFKSGYEPHAYREWLVEYVAHLLDDTLTIGGAGLLRNRAQAYVQVEVPDTIEGPGGVAFRPRLLACTSFDGSLATTYKPCVGLVVCDNTRDAALAESGEVFKVKHTKNSNAKIESAREALGIVYKIADDFNAEVERLLNWTVEDKQFEKFLDKYVPLKTGDAATKHNATIVEKKRETLTALYKNDPRCAPWTATAYGVAQACNTYDLHFATVKKGVGRGSRNMENILSGKQGSDDANVLTILSSVVKPPKVLATV